MLFSAIIILVFLIITGWLARKSLVWSVSFLLFLLPVYLIRINILGIPTTALELGIYLITGLWLWSVVSGKRKFVWHNMYWLGLVWILIGFVSVLISSEKMASLGLWKGWIVDPICLMIVVSQAVKKRWQVGLLFAGFKYLLGLLGTVGLIQYLFGVIGTPDGRLAVFWDSPNYLAMLLVPVLIFVLAGLVKYKFSWWGLISWWLGLLALILSASYVGIGSLVLGLIFLAWNWWIKDINKFMGLVLLGILIISGFVIWQAGSERFSSMIDLSQRSSVSVRLEVWQIGWRMVRENPIWGIGLGNFEEKYIEYAPLVFHPPTEWRMLHAHNLYLQSWIEMSVFGLLILLAIILIWWSRLLKLKNANSFWVGPIMAILLVWVIGGLFDTPYFKNDLSAVFWLLFGVTVATGDMASSSKIKVKNLKSQRETEK